MAPASFPYFLSSLPWSSESVNLSMAQSVWLIIKNSFTPRNSLDTMRDRTTSSVTMPPAFLMMLVALSSPGTKLGPTRGSMQVRTARPPPDDDSWIGNRVGKRVFGNSAGNSGPDFAWSSLAFISFSVSLMCQHPSFGEFYCLVEPWGLSHEIF